jgi:hypothetical protein
MARVGPDADGNADTAATIELRGLVDADVLPWAPRSLAATDLKQQVALLLPDARCTGTSETTLALTEELLEVAVAHRHAGVGASTSPGRPIHLDVRASQGP